MNDNGKTELQKKKEAFEANPNEFIRKSDVMLGVIKDGDSVILTTGINDIERVEQCYAKIVMGTPGLLQILVKKQNNIITPKSHSFRGLFCGNK